jgi:hypothetical protein
VATGNRNRFHHRTKRYAAQKAFAGSFTWDVIGGERFTWRHERTGNAPDRAVTQSAELCGARGPGEPP